MLMSSSCINIIKSFQYMPVAVTFFHGSFFGSLWSVFAYGSCCTLAKRKRFITWEIQWRVVKRHIKDFHASSQAHWWNIGFISLDIFPIDFQVDHHSTTDIWTLASILFHILSHRTWCQWLCNLDCDPGVGMQTAEPQKALCLLMPCLCSRSCL